MFYYCVCVRGTRTCIKNVELQGMCVTTRYNVSMNVTSYHRSIGYVTCSTTGAYFHVFFLVGYFLVSCLKAVVEMIVVPDANATDDCHKNTNVKSHDC